MATIPLKDITFPGLDNTYTIPEIDNTLSTAGKAADAKKTGDEIDQLKSEITDKSDTVDMLKAFPTDTASGAVASFADGANVPVKSLIVDITPVQSGSGDPSPDNVRPISGWSEVNVGVNGKNLFDSHFADYKKPYDYYIKPIKLESGKKYVIKAELVGTAVTGTAFGITKKGDKYSEFTPYYVVSSTGTVSSFEFTVDDAFTSPKLVAYVSGQAKFDEVMNNYNITLEVKADQNPYESYSGTFLNIQLGQTVYGGTLDVVSGVLTIDRAMITPKAAGRVDVSTYVYCVVNIEDNPSLSNNNGDLISNQFFVGTPPLYPGHCYLTNAGKFIVFCPIDQSLNTKELVDAWLAENEVQFCYLLATPITVTLTPHEVRSLLGDNNIWADSGDSAVEYKADPTLYIQRLTDPDVDMIADANITSGSYFMVGNTLYKATANIASGAAISPNVNCTRKSLSEALNELNA